MDLEIFDPYESEVRTGTTLVAAEFDGGVVLGADSRTSSGSFCVNRYADKLTPVSDRILCCRSGSSADTQAVSDIVTIRMEALEILHGTPPLVEMAANVFKEMCYNYRDMLMASIIVGGWDKKKGGQVYQIPLGGMLLRLPVAAGGSGSTYISGFLDSAYREGMSKEDCEQFVKKAVSLAIARDNSSSGSVRLATITKEGINRQIFTHDQLPEFNRF